MPREVLKQARKDKKMTQQAVADYLGITMRHYQRIESASNIGSFSLWDGLEDLLGIHQRYLRKISDIHHAQKEYP